MKFILTLDSAGRVGIPKPMRDQLRLEAGDTLALETDGERMVLKPVRSTAAMSREHGIWVFRSARAVAATKTHRALERVRSARRRRGRNE